MTLYHLSAVPLGPRVVLRPRRPRDPMIGESSRVQRVCVSPTIRGCLTALQGAYYNRGRWYVYQLDVPEDLVVDPIRVPDARLTGERWLLEPVEACHVGLVRAL